MDSPLPAQSQRILLDLASRSVRAAAAGQPAPQLPDHPDLMTRGGAFVTLRHGEELRGCIGRVQTGDLTEMVRDSARAAATTDPRFPPVTHAELETLSLEISVLGPFTPLEAPERLQVGRHGVFLALGDARGLLLPQVALQAGVDAQGFLELTARKAGLHPQAWMEAQVHIFTAFVFSGAV